MSHLDRLVEGELYKFGIFIDCIESDKERLAKDGVHSCRSNRLKVEVVLLNLGQGLTTKDISQNFHLNNILLVFRSCGSLRLSFAGRALGRHLGGRGVRRGLQNEKIGPIYQTSEAFVPI